MVPCAGEETDNVYFREALDLFRDTQWLYNSPVTEVLVWGHLDAFPNGWLEVLQELEIEELNDFVVEKFLKTDWPKTLLEFVEKCNRVNGLQYEVRSRPAPVLPANFLKGLSPKKQHEIAELAELVHKHCLALNIRAIVDAGAGLGYVCQLLYHLYGYRVLGLETSPGNVRSARNRQNKLYPESQDHVKYVVCEITSDSVSKIAKALEEEFGVKENICLIGLHACGDLSVSTAQIFMQMAATRLLILVPCCYHRLSIRSERSENAAEHFNNFPVSQTFKEVQASMNYDAGKFLRRPFLRLASQEPAQRWQNMSESSHNEHSFHVLARAVLELYAHRNSLQLRKRLRKATRKSQCFSFEAYLEDALKRYAFERRDADSDAAKGSFLGDTAAGEEDVRKEITSLWKDNSQKLKAAEIYTGLQLLLQGPAETVILRDRVCRLKECGFLAEIVPVMTKTLSPRCHAIVASK